MVITGIDEFNSKSNFIPFFPIDHDLADQSYIIIHDQNGSKTAHMSVLIDLIVVSTNTYISGLLIDIVANIDNGNYPHTTVLRYEQGKEEKENLIFFRINNLADSKYLAIHDSVPSYLLTPFTSIK